MDLRKYINNESDLNKAIKFIKNGTLFYQPFIIHDNIIIGEARNFIKQYSDVRSIYDYNLYSKNFPELETVNGVKRNLISENEKDFFIKINNEYDFLYEFCVNEIIKSKVTRVVYSIQDKDKRTSGKSFKILKSKNLKMKYVH